MDLLVAEGFTPEAAGEALHASGLGLSEVDARETDRTFSDTFDGRVRAAGLAAVHQDGRLVLLDRETGVERVGMRAPALEQIVGVRALLALARVRGRARLFAVLDDERKTVARITLEHPALVSATGHRTALRPRLSLAAVRGYSSEYERVRAALVHVLGCEPVLEPLVDEAVSAAGGAVAGVSGEIEVALIGEQRADAAAVAVLRALLDVIAQNLEGAIADTDAEFLHDLRVAVRRSRAVQRELRGVFPPAELAHFRAELRWLQRVTGPARDLDVHVLELDSMRALVPAAMRSELDPLLAVLGEHRKLAHRELARSLSSERVVMLHARWAAFLEELVGLPVEDRPDAVRPIRSLAGERIGSVYRRMLKLGAAIGERSPPEEYHELRKHGKELRYLLELFGAPLFPDWVVGPMVDSLKALQDVLGRHQDREIQAATLRSLREEVSARPGGAAALMAMGALAARLVADEHEARARFAPRFQAFAAKSQRRLVKQTFG